MVNFEEHLWPPAIKERLEKDIEDRKNKLLETAKNISEVGNDSDYLVKGLMIFEEKARELFKLRQELKEVDQHLGEEERRLQAGG